MKISTLSLFGIFCAIKNTTSLAESNFTSINDDFLLTGNLVKPNNVPSTKLKFINQLLVDDDIEDLKKNNLRSR